MDESDVIHQIDEQISRLDKIQQVAQGSELDKTPAKGKGAEIGGLPADKFPLYTSNSNFLSKESTFVNQSSAQSDSGLDLYGYRYDNIQEQLKLL